MNDAKNGKTCFRSKFERGGFLTKWKGRVASVAPSVSVIALSVVLGANPAASQDITGTVSGGSGSLFAPNSVQNGDTITLGTASSTNLTNTGTFTNTGDVTITGNTTQTGNVDLTGDLGVTGDSVFTGSVDIAGPTNITNTFGVQVGVTTLDVNGSSFNVQVGTSTSNLNMTTTSVNLSADGNGFSAGGGNASVTGTSNAIVTGGTSSITVSNSGVALSGSGGAPVVLSGVADPVNATDAVNLRTLQRELGSLESELSGGIAQTMAMTQLPYPEPGQDFSFGMALGGFNGEAGFAMGGAARLSDTMVLRGSASYSDAGGAGGAVGIGWSW